MALLVIISSVKGVTLRYTQRFRCDIWHKRLQCTRGATNSCNDNNGGQPGPSKKKQKSNQARYNAINIQMLSESLHKQIFGTASVADVGADEKGAIKKHLGDHNLWGKSSGTLADVDFSLPKLLGSNIDEHFRILATKQTKPYFEHAECVASMSLPPRPRKWIFRKGWTRYDPKTGTCEETACPEDEALVFDVEVLMSEGQFPTLAVATSPKAW